MGEGRRARSTLAPPVLSYAATPSQGSGFGGGWGSVPSAVKISIGVADGDAPFSRQPWKDPAWPRFGNTATTANKMTIQRLNSTFSLDMRPPSVKKKSRETWIGMPPSELRVSLNGKSKRRVTRTNMVGI